MSDNTPSTSAKDERIKTLEEQVEKLDNRLNRLAKVHVEYNELLDMQLKTIEQYQEDLFQRLKNIELKVFPHLAEGITHLRDIIGDGDDKVNNPLDRRRP